MTDPKLLRFKLWDGDHIDGGHVVVVDPFAVATVVETTRRRAYGGNNDVAVIRLHDGTEYTVCDDGRTVAAGIWLGKSIVNT